MEEEGADLEEQAILRKGGTEGSQVPSLELLDQTGPEACWYLIVT